MDVGKIEIECNEHATLASANVDYALVRLTTECLRNNGMRVMPFGNEQLRKRRRKVFVELEFHAAVSTTRSRANSAAYDIAAATSSRRSVG